MGSCFFIDLLLAWVYLTEMDLFLFNLALTICKRLLSHLDCTLHNERVVGHLAGHNFRKLRLGQTVSRLGRVEHCLHARGWPLWRNWVLTRGETSHVFGCVRRAQDGGRAILLQLLG